MSNERDRVYIAKNDKELYEKLRRESIGKGRENKDLFLLAVATGCRSGMARPLKTREGFVRAEYFSERDMALLNTAAVAKSGSVDIICDKSLVFQIAEQYAHVGIRILVDIIKSSPYEGFEKRFEKDLYETYEAKRERK